MADHRLHSLATPALLVLGSSALLLLLRLSRRRASARAAAEYWRTLERGHYLDDSLCPRELAAAIVAEMQRCLEAPELPLSEVHKLRKQHAKSACAELQDGQVESKRARNERLAAMLRKVAVATSPNFKDVLRARVLASPQFPALQALCRRFIHEHLLPHLRSRLGESAFAVQCQPSMRFNLPGSSALGARPDDSDEMIGLHTDGEYGHQPGEMNFAIALTPFYGSNGLYVESEPGLGDFHEINMGVGRVFAFAGVSRRHHNKRNTTGSSRVSLDFRVLPMSRYDYTRDRGDRKATREHRFTIGEYFELVTVECGGTAVTSGRGLIFRDGAS